jgi:hypothetical protein
MPSDVGRSVPSVQHSIEPLYEQVAWAVWGKIGERGGRPIAIAARTDGDRIGVFGDPPHEPPQRPRLTRPSSDDLYISGVRGRNLY